MRVRYLSGAFPSPFLRAIALSHPSILVRPWIVYLLSTFLNNLDERQLWPARHPDLLSLRDGVRLCATRSSARLALLHASGCHARSRNGARDSTRVPS